VQEKQEDKPSEGDQSTQRCTYYASLLFGSDIYLLDEQPKLICREELNLVSAIMKMKLSLISTEFDTKKILKNYEQK
jgi:hypothetical protein